MGYALRMDSLSPGDEFIRLYNEIDHWMREQTGDSRGSFFKRVDYAARKVRAVRQYAEELKEYAELRNAIIHYRDYPEQVIATPHDDVLARFRMIIERLMRPERLMPRFKRDVHTFATNTPLANLLNYTAKHGYSQVPVVDEGKLRMLTNDGIASWLADQVSEQCLDLNTATVADVMQHEPRHSFDLLARGATVDEAREKFEKAHDRNMPRLYAILITETGQDTEELLGIVTPYDLMEDT